MPADGVPGRHFYTISRLAGGESTCLNGVHVVGHLIDQQRDDVLGHIVFHTLNQQKARIWDQ